MTTDSNALPFQQPLQHMLAQSADAIPEGEGWLYEPKWDGFRTLVFFDGKSAYLQSRDLKPLGRYFPELETAAGERLARPDGIDGETVIAGPKGLDFEALQMRLHPAASRVNMLAEEDAVVVRGLRPAGSRRRGPARRAVRASAANASRRR